MQTHAHPAAHPCTLPFSLAADPTPNPTPATLTGTTQQPTLGRQPLPALSLPLVLSRRAGHFPSSFPASFPARPTGTGGGANSMRVGSFPCQSLLSFRPVFVTPLSAPPSGSLVFSISGKSGRNRSVFRLTWSDPRPVLPCILAPAFDDGHVTRRSPQHPQTRRHGQGCILLCPSKRIWFRKRVRFPSSAIGA